MWFGIITLFPEMFHLLDYGIVGRARRDKLISVNCWNPRDYAEDKHGRVDDRPYGGGPGMVMQPQPLYDAIEAAEQAAPKKPWVIHLSPQGRCFNQHAAMKLLNKKCLILIAGRYEGIDERLLELKIDEEWSIGDFVLTGGELPALTMIDVMTRLIPDALGHKDSAANDSHSMGLLEYPQFTRPPVYRGMSVPEILLSGDHQAIERWRLKQALGRTWLKRPDLFKTLQLDEFQLKLLQEFVDELKE